MFAWRDNYISYNGSGAANDPYWTSVSLLQNYEYPVTGVADLSTNNFQPIITGPARPTSRSPFAAGNGGSYKFDTSTASQFIIPNDGTVFNPGSNNFTAECWAYIPAFPSSNTEILGISTTSASSGYAVCRISVSSAGSVLFLCQNSSGGWISTSGSGSGTITTGAWYHYAAVRNGTAFTLYINGVSKLTYTYSGALNYLGSTSTSFLANLPVGTGFTGAANCYITNARWVNGTAVYTAAFTPPTTPLTAITNTGFLFTFANIGNINNSVYNDISVNSFIPTVTGAPTYSGISPFTNTYPGSLQLVAASTQYLTVATDAVFTYATGDFTMECWVYFSTVGTTQYIIDQRNSGTASAIIPTIYLDSTPVIIYYVNGAARITGTVAISANTWYHIAVSRTSTSTNLFVNGTQNGSTYSDSNSYAASRVSVGSNGATAGNYLNGYISNVRLSKGFAYYTTTFTPSTVPLTASSTYTSLLLANPGYNDLSTFNQNISTTQWTGSMTGTVAQSSQVSPTQYKFGTQSSYYVLNGYQTVTSSTSLLLGTGDFTIECWVYRSVAGVLHSLLGKGSGSSTGWALQINSSNQLIWVSGTSSIKTSTTTIAATTWTYVAITRSGTTGYMFINGTIEGTGYTDSGNYNQTNNLYIGTDRSNTNGLTGYLDDIRITKGVCRYTATFAAPTTAFPTS